MKFLSYIRDKVGPVCLAALAVLLDQLTKWLVVANMRVGETIPLWEGVFHFTFRTNTGAAFSLFDAPDQRWIFMTASTVGILFMLAYLLLARDNPFYIRYPLGMMIGGGIGNMIDRILNGYVVDMLDFRLINFPVFNVADCFVTVGATLLVVGVLYEAICEMRANKRKGDEQ